MHSAEDWSDGLRDAAGVGYAASVVAAPSGTPGGDWIVAKAQRAAVGLGAFFTETFLGPARHSRAQVALGAEPVRGGAGLRLDMRF